MPVVAVYLHGSWASEYELGDSDLDLAILANQRLGVMERIEFQHRLTIALNLKQEIDLADLYNATTVFAAIVITSGLRIYSTGVDSDIFEVKTLAAYARLNEERLNIVQDIVRRGTVYGEHT